MTLYDSLMSERSSADIRRAAADRLFPPRAGSHFGDVAAGLATMGTAADPEGERQTPTPPNFNEVLRRAARRGRVYEPAFVRRVVPMDGFGGYGPVIPVHGLPGHKSSVEDPVPAKPRDDLIADLREAGARQRGRKYDGYRPTILGRKR